MSLRFGCFVHVLARERLSSCCGIKMEGKNINVGLVYPLAATSSTGLPWGVCRYASAQASFRETKAAGSAKPLAATKCSRAASQ